MSDHRPPSGSGGRGRGYGGDANGQYFMDNLQLPGARAIAALSYYQSTTWPKIAQLITTRLSSQNISCSVAPMVEAGDEEVFKPWIMVRVIPADGNRDIPSAQDIKNLMIENEYFDPQYNVHVESGMSAARPITTRAHARDFKLYDGYHINNNDYHVQQGHHGHHHGPQQHHVHGRHLYGRKQNSGGGGGKSIPQNFPSNQCKLSLDRLICWLGI